MKESYFYKKLRDKKVKCQTCFHFCVISQGERGKCGVRQNIEGKLQLLTYGKVAVIGEDPIEKKPFFHFLPGTKTLSLSSQGCSLFCDNCQNWELSQEIKKGGHIKGKEISPEDIVNLALKKKLPSISFTYTDPTSYAEYTLDVMKIAKLKKIKNCFVSHGFMSKLLAIKTLPYLDAVNIDIKSFSEDFYQKNCKASLKPVLENAISLKKAGVWVEVTTLAIPTLSDDRKMFTDIANFIYQKLGSETPWHISKFYSAFSYKLEKLPDTSTETLDMAYCIGKEAGLKHVYTNHKQNTYCSKCGTLNIGREKYLIERYSEDGSCIKCSKDLDICL